MEGQAGRNRGKSNLSSGYQPNLNGFTPNAVGFCNTFLCLPLPRPPPPTLSPHPPLSLFVMLPVATPR